jgi:outer membrane protein assembly factor BamB
MRVLGGSQTMTRSKGWGRIRLVVSASLAAIVVPLAAGSAVLTSGSASAAPGTDWTSYLNGPSHNSYNPSATSITVPGIQAGNLQPVWRWTPPPSPNAGQPTIMATPVVLNGVFYVGVEDGIFYAVSEATQQVLWSDFLGLRTPAPGGGCGTLAQGIISTATVAPDPTTGVETVYVSSQDGNMYALNAATGAVEWKSRVDTPSQTVDDYYAWSSPTVANGKVYVGLASWCDMPLVSAGVIGFDQSTGAQIGMWHSLPPGGLGASVWGTVGVMPDGEVIATTGNATGSFQNQPLYNESMVRLNGSNLALQDAWQIPSSLRVNDGDFGASPTFFTGTVNGVQTPLVGACNKDGFYYALNPSNLAAGPVWQHQMSQGGGGDLCVAGAIWNGSALIEAGGAPTTINGTLFSGSVQELNPSTGQPIWQTGLPGPPIGSCSEDGAGVVACGVYTGDTPQDMGFYLLNASNGQIIGHISTPGAFLFAQPVFDNNDLILAGRNGIGVTGYEITTPGAPITSVSPSTITAGAQSTVTLNGSGFQKGAKVFVSGTLVGGQHGTFVQSSTRLTFTLTPAAAALGGQRDLTVVEPGSPIVTNTCSACLTIQSKLGISASSSLPAGTQWQFYNQSIGITGGVGPYNVSITSGQLPPGVSLDQNGNLTANEITSAGTFTFTVQVTDSSVPTPQVATKTFTFNVAAAPEPQTITFTSTNPSPVTVGAPHYTPTATASSGLPVTISLDPSSSGCTLGGGVVSFPAAGTCVVDATQAGNTTWAPASLQQSITINPGSNSMIVSPITVSAVSTGNTLTFTFTAPTGGMSSGEVKLAVPTAWPDAPSINPSLAGYVTSTCGGLSAAARSVVITGVTLAAGQNCTIIYGSTAGGGKGAVAPAATGPSTFTASVATTSSGTLTPLANPPVVTVDAPNGSGTMTVSPTTLGAGSTGNTLTFTYTAATGGLSNGALKLAVPTGWPNAPSTTPSSAGYVTSTCGTVSVAGTTIMTSGVVLAGGQTCTTVYGSTAGGGPGAGAPTTTGTYTFTSSEASTSPGTPKALATSPAVTI